MATPHTFCAFRDAPKKSSFLTVVPAKTHIFCATYNCVGKADIGKGFWNPKRKLGLTMHFSEIIELQFGKKFHYIVLYFGTF